MMEIGEKTAVLLAAILAVLLQLHTGLCDSMKCTLEQESFQSVSYRNKSLVKIPNDIPTDVRHLDLGLNLISRLPNGVFSRFSNLTNLDLSWNKLTFIEEGVFADMTSLECLDLTGNNISTINVDALTGSDRIHSLVMAGNGMTEWDFTIVTGMAGTLTYLDLSNNKLEGFTKYNNSYGRFISLTIVRINNNRLTSLGNAWLPWLPSIRELYLEDNSISHIPWNFFANMSTLQTLDLSRNQIVQLNSKSCIGLEAVAYLNLDFNEMTSVPLSCLSAMENLTCLTLNGNRFQVIPQRSFQGLSHLSRLEISNCSFLRTVECQAFAMLENLQELRLTNNEILSNVDADVWGNTSMKLKSLALDSNKLLRTLPQNVLSGLSKLTDFYLRDLDLNCDCYVRWVKEASENWINKVKFHLDNTICTGHTSRNRTLFIQVKAEEMVCETPLVVSSSVVSDLPDTAQLKVTITNTGLPVVTWTLPTGATIDTGEYKPSENSTTVIMTSTATVSSVMVCSLNISNVTEEFYGQYTLTSTNMAGITSKSLVLKEVSRDPALLLQLQLTIALASMVAVFVILGMVCLINTNHVNGHEFEKTSLLRQDETTVTEFVEISKPLQVTDSPNNYTKSDSHSRMAAACADVERDAMSERAPTIAEVKSDIVMEARANSAYQPDDEESTKL